MGTENKKFYYCSGNQTRFVCYVESCPLNVGHELAHGPEATVETIEEPVDGYEKHFRPGEITTCLTFKDGNKVYIEGGAVLIEFCYLKENMHY